MLVSEVTGDVPKIIGNEECLYESDLTEYFRLLFFKSSNLYNPYHNFRHMLHVLWLCHKACRYYQNRLAPRQMRNLLITALFHDFDHPGHPHPGVDGAVGNQGGGLGRVSRTKALAAPANLGSLSTEPSVSM